MLKNYLRVAFRNLWRSKFFSFLNLSGLVIGMLACLMILQYVHFENNFDQYHQFKERIYRVRLDLYKKGKFEFKSATIFPVVAPTIKKDFPEVEEFARIYKSQGVFRYGDKLFNEKNVFFADASFFRIFSYPLLMGNRTDILKQTNTCVISEQTAKRYFGKHNPLGKALKWENFSYTITGVLKDIRQSHLEMDILLSYPSIRQHNFSDDPSDSEKSWRWYDFYSYLLLKPGTDVAALNKKLYDLDDKYTERKKRQSKVIYSLQKMEDIHLYSDLNQEASVNGDGKSVFFLGIIAFFILLIAWINYVNLSTARALDRAKEVGIRKVIGAKRLELIKQFVLEAFVLNLIAFLCVISLMELLMPAFAALSGKELYFNLWKDPFYLGLLVCVFVLGIFFSGLYPAFVLSGFKPSLVLKGKFSNSKKGTWLRKSLVVFQFAASVILIAGTYAVYSQLTYMRKQNLGINISRTLVMETGNIDPLLRPKIISYTKELEQFPFVKSAAISSSVPGQEIYWTASLRRLPLVENDGGIQGYHLGTDPGFAKTYRLAIVKGRFFEEKFRNSDARSVVLTEYTAILLGFKDLQEAINQKIAVLTDTFKIIGISANFHQEGLRKSQMPFVFRPWERGNNFISIKLDGKAIASSLSEIRADFVRKFPQTPFVYFFADTFFDQQYRAEKQFGNLFGLFALLAIFVASLGLFGLSSFTVAQRTKEIGIRKVLGANISQLLVLLTKDFINLVCISIVLAIPVAYWLIEQWLENYAYRTHITFAMFVVPVALVLTITLITVSFQTFKSALANPVKALRYE